MSDLWTKPNCLRRPCRGRSLECVSAIAPPLLKEQAAGCAEILVRRSSNWCKMGSAKELGLLDSIPRLPNSAGNRVQPTSDRRPVGRRLPGAVNARTSGQPASTGRSLVPPVSGQTTPPSERSSGLACSNSLAPPASRSTRPNTGPSDLRAVQRKGKSQRKVFQALLPPQAQLARGSRLRLLPAWIPSTFLTRLKSEIARVIPTAWNNTRSIFRLCPTTLDERRRSKDRRGARYYPDRIKRRPHRCGTDTS